MQIINAETVTQMLSFESLIPLLRQAFAQQFSMPQRQVFALDEIDLKHDAFALLPAWNEQVIGVKAFTYFPDNILPSKSLYSKIMLFNRKTGEPLALVDGTTITYWRTAAVSALASQLLSNLNSQRLFLFGSGNLAPYLIKAHLAVRPITEVIIAARNTAKIDKLIDKLNQEHQKIVFKQTTNMSSDIANANIVICATSSPTPLFSFNDVTPGTHIDCLGNHMPNQQECDSKTVVNSRVYVDSLINTLNEAGELIIPLNQKLIEPSHIIAELKDLCINPEIGRQTENEITLFKSVGTAISDIATAHHIYNLIN